MGAENNSGGVFFPTSASRSHPGPAGGGKQTEEVGIWAKEWVGRREILSQAIGREFLQRTPGRRCMRRRWGGVKVSDLSNQEKSGL